MNILVSTFNFRLFLLELFGSLCLSSVCFMMQEGHFLPMAYAGMMLGLMYVSRTLEPSGGKHCPDRNRSPEICYFNPILAALAWITRTDTSILFVTLNHWMPQILGVLLAWAYMAISAVPHRPFIFYHPGAGVVLLNEFIYSFLLLFVWTRCRGLTNADVSIGFIYLVYFTSTITDSCGNFITSIFYHSLILTPKGGSMDIVNFGFMSLFGSILALICFCILYDFVLKCDLFDLYILHQSLTEGEDGNHLQNNLQVCTHSIGDFTFPFLIRFSRTRRIYCQFPIDSLKIKTISFPSRKKVDVNIVAIFCKNGEFVNACFYGKSSVPGFVTFDESRYVHDEIDIGDNYLSSVHGGLKHCFGSTTSFEESIRSTGADTVLFLLHVFSRKAYVRSLNTIFSFVNVNGYDLILEKFDGYNNLCLGTSKLRENCLLFLKISRINEVEMENTGGWSVELIDKRFKVAQNTAYFDWKKQIDQALCV